MNFFTIFHFEFSSSGWVGTEFRSKIFFLSFSAYLIPFWLKIMPEIGFLISFYFFFWNFLARVECEQNSGLRVFSLILGLSYPVLAKNNAGNGFFNFSNFFGFFSEFPCTGRVWMEFRNNFFFFFFHFLALSQPVLDKIMSELTFFNFFNFFTIFYFKFSSSGWVGTEFRSRILDRKSVV